MRNLEAGTQNSKGPYSGPFAHYLRPVRRTHLHREARPEVIKSRVRRVGDFRKDVPSPAEYVMLCGNWCESVAALGAIGRAHRRLLGRDME